MFRKAIVKNTLLLTAASLGLRSVSILFQSYLTRVIGAEGIGKLQLAMTAGAVAMTVGLSGARVAAMNLTARYFGRGDLSAMKQAIARCLCYSLFLSLFAGGMLSLLARPIAGRLLHDPTLSPALILLGLTLAPSCLMAVLGGCYTALGKVRTLVAVNAADRLCSIALTMLWLKLLPSYDLNAVSCAVIGGGAICSSGAAGVLLYLLMRDLRTVQAAKGGSCRPFLQLCIPLALSEYLRSGLSAAEHFLIPRGLRASSESYDYAMACYGTIHGMVFPVLMFPCALIAALSDVLVPTLSRMNAQNDRPGIRAVIRKSITFGIAFALVSAAGEFLLAPWLGQTLYSSELAGHYLRLFAPLILILYCDALVDGMLKGLCEQAANAKINTVTAALDVLLLLLLLPRLGIIGYLISFTVTHTINFAMSLSRLIRVTRSPQPLKRDPLQKSERQIRHTENRSGAPGHPGRTGADPAAKSA